NSNRRLSMVVIPSARLVPLGRLRSMSRAARRPTWRCSLEPSAPFSKRVASILCTHSLSGIATSHVGLDDLRLPGPLGVLVDERREPRRLTPLHHHSDAVPHGIGV